MKEKLIIRNFGPIKDVELELGRFNILIGEQATGKSTVAKVLAVCRYFSYIIDESNIGGNAFEQGLFAWGLNEAIREGSFISYQCHHYSFIAQYVNGVIDTEDWKFEDDVIVNTDYSFFSLTLTPHSQEFNNLLGELDKVVPNRKRFPSLNHPLPIPTSFFINDVKNVLDNPFYLPTQRGLQSIFSIGQSSIQNLSDSLFGQLAKMDGITRNFIKETYIAPLDIYYKNVQGRGYIRKANETEFYSLFNAASGYQAMIPIVLVAMYYGDTKRKTKTLLIEEPELDVFPTAQNALINYLSEKAKEHDSMIVMTTHSPYTLTSFNNLTYAYIVGQKEEEGTSQIVDKKYWINPDDVCAYRMKTDGTCESIFDREEGMIMAEKIDEASTQINNAFDKLLSLEIQEK